MNYATKRTVIFVILAAGVSSLIHVQRTLPVGNFSAGTQRGNGISTPKSAIRHGSDRPSGVPCKEIGRDIVCNSHVYRNVKWHMKYERITATITAYDAQEFPGRTASGAKGVPGKTAACPSSIPLGSRIRFVERDIGYTCNDRTASRFNGRFDLFVGTRREALAHGKRVEEIEITYK